MDKKVVFIFLFLFSLTFISASFGYDTAEVIDSEVTINTYTGNLTNLSELQDVDVAGVNDDDVLTYNSATGNWEDQVPALGSEVDPKWTNNFTLYNSSWSSTYNVTYHGYNSTGLIINWSGNYLTLAQLLGFSYYNSTDFDIDDYLLTANWNATNTSYYLASNPFGFYNSTIFDYNDYYLKSNPFGFFNSTNPQTETDPFWTDNFTLYNSTWSAGASETDPLWTDNFTKYNTTWSSITNTSYALVSEPLWTDNFTKYNTTWSIDYNSTGLIIDWNRTSLIINWSGDYLTAEVDPKWTDNFTKYNTTWSSITNTSYMQFSDWNATNTSYYLATNPFGFYNITDFDINDYLDLATILGFAYYNSTDFDISDYLNLTTLLGFGYYNSTDFDISDYSTTATILGWSYYNSTDFDIDDYLLTANWNATNTSYYLATNPFTFWNSTFATFNKTYADTLYYGLSNLYGYYNSTDFSIADYRTLSNYTFEGNVDLQDNNLIDVNDIGTATDEIDDVYIGTNQKIYFGDGQESSIYFNGTHMIFD